MSMSSSLEQSSNIYLLQHDCLRSFIVLTKRGPRGPLSCCSSDNQAERIWFLMRLRFYVDRDGHTPDRLS